MKVLYSQLKKYLPDLKADAREVANAFTLTGFMLDKYFEVEYEGPAKGQTSKKDFLLDLEVRQNRADSFGVQGLARELSAYFDIPLKIPTFADSKGAGSALPIEVKAKDSVKRLMAVKLQNLKLAESPKWLKDYLAFYEINSINTLVDLTNYVMIETGHPSHAFDSDLINGNLTWEINPTYKKMTSLDGTEVDLVKEALVVSDGKKPLALAGIVGGIGAEINKETKNAIVEMAVYDGALIRRNARQMRIMTEASSRLEKFMDPDSISSAFNMLISLILENCKGEIASQIYENYLQPTPKVEIEVDLTKVQQIAGIEIPFEESKTYLKRLGFEIRDDQGSKIKVERPINRLDVEIEEDAFEEIIRMKGYNKIPSNNLTVTVTKDITPSHLKLTEKLQNTLAANGFDEVRSWILVDHEKNINANYLTWDEIKVTNSINEEVPYLRQSIAVSLLGQLETYKKNNILDIRLFETGKVFGKTGKEYSEHDSVGILIDKNDIDLLKMNVERLLREVGINNIIYTKSENPPKTAHPSTSWSIKAVVKDSKEEDLGIIYVSNKTMVAECCIAEININVLDKIVSSIPLEVKGQTAQEINQKIVSLDSNIILNKDEDINKEVIKRLSEIESKVWQWIVVDKYPEADKVKYTVRISYTGLTDPEAKELHSQIFGH